MKVYAYVLRVGLGYLEGYARSLGQPLYHWIADGACLTMGEGMPQDWREQGAVFGPQGELRWWRTENNYQALLLTSDPVDGLDPISGIWEAKEGTFFLQNLNDLRVNPNFPAYPHGSSNGRFKAMIYYCNGIATFISLRACYEL